MFDNLKLVGKNLINLDENVNVRLKKLIISEVFFTCINDNIYLSSSLKGVMEFREKQGKVNIICEQLAECYLDSGLVTPPFTIFKGIYKMPAFSKFVGSDNSFALDFDTSFLDATPFLNEADIFDHLRDIIKRDLKYEKPNHIVCTLSGGADSAVLLSLLVAESPLEKIDALCCEMPGLRGESDKAAAIAQMCDINFVKYTPKSINPATVIESYARGYKNLVFDSVVPVISTMLRDYSQKYQSHKNSKICLVEGQGADTVLVGLPHAFTLAIYRLGLAPLFRILSIILPNPSDDIRRRSRTLYRVVKSVHLLSAITWQESILHALDLHKLKGTDYYLCYQEMIDQYFMVTKDRQKALVLFFLQIISTRELQKYQMLGKGVIPILPFMDQKFVARCVVTRSSMFFRFPYRKIPIFNKARELFGDIFNSRKTFPFVVQYGETKITEENFGSAIRDEYSFRKYCLDFLLKINLEK
jgi:asparagine synthetase B (glutamine-hydrolysing)